MWTKLPSCENRWKWYKFLDLEPNHPQHLITCFLIQGLPFKKFREDLSLVLVFLLVNQQSEATNLLGKRNKMKFDSVLQIHRVPKKKCDHIFDDKLKQNYPFTKIFGTLITKSIGHRQVYLVSHLTYFVHLLYLGKLSRPKYHEFSFKFLIFSMLQY